MENPRTTCKSSSSTFGIAELLTDQAKTRYSTSGQRSQNQNLTPTSKQIDDLFEGLNLALPHGFASMFENAQEMQKAKQLWREVLDGFTANDLHRGMLAVAKEAREKPLSPGEFRSICLRGKPQPVEKTEKAKGRWDGVHRAPADWLQRYFKVYGQPVCMDCYFEQHKELPNLASHTAVICEFHHKQANKR